MVILVVVVTVVVVVMVEVVMVVAAVTIVVVALITIIIIITVDIIIKVLADFLGSHSFPTSSDIYQMPCYIKRLPGIFPPCLPFSLFPYIFLAVTTCIILLS